MRRDPSRRTRVNCFYVHPPPSANWTLYSGTKPENSFIKFPRISLVYIFRLHKFFVRVPYWERRLFTEQNLFRWLPDLASRADASPPIHNHLYNIQTLTLLGFSLVANRRVLSGGRSTRAQGTHFGRLTSADPVRRYGGVPTFPTSGSRGGRRF